MKFQKSALLGVLACGVGTLDVDAFVCPATTSGLDVSRNQHRTLSGPSYTVFGLTSGRSISSRLRISSSDVAEKEETFNANSDVDIDSIVIQQDEAGIFQVENKEMHDALLKQNPDRLVVLKFFAPWCRACKGLAPRFKAVAMNDQNKDIIFAEMSVQNNKDYVKSLGILALPNVHFYAGNQGLVENFPCGPSKMPILKTKLREYLKKSIDKNTGLILPMEASIEEEQGESEPMIKETISEEKPSSSVQIKEQGKGT